MSDLVLRTDDGGIAFLTLNRPDALNALSPNVFVELRSHIDSIASSIDTVGCVVLRGAGRSFCAGNDLKAIMAGERAPVPHFQADTLQAIEDLPQPVIAAVQGTAVAAGCQLVATCDLAVAASTAVFGTPGVRIGLFCSTPMVAVSRAIGRKRALQLLLTGDVIDAATAADWGLVNEVVAPGEVDARAFALAGRIAEASPLTLQIGKQAFYRQIDLPQEQAYAEMREIMATNAVTCDAQEGMQAFLDKRPPVWEGR
jgi:enoyl-CoA hydratase/carnithine racemase